jgi:hypothetical protein
MGELAKKTGFLRRKSTEVWPHRGLLQTAWPQYPHLRN